MKRLPHYFKYLATFFVLYLLCSTSVAQKRLIIEPLLSSAQLQRLGKQLKSHIIDVQRTGYAAKGYHFPQDRIDVGRGVLITEHLILTSAHWLDLRTDESNFSIEVKCLGHINMIKAKVIEISKKEGWAILNSPSPLSCQPAPTVSNMTDPSFYIGKSLYFYEAYPHLPAKLTMSGIAPSPMQFYWLLTGRVFNGSPLFDHKGRLVTVAVMADIRTQNVNLYSLILPSESISSALNKIREHKHLTERERAVIK
jgi:hypothetical protein